MWAGWDGEVMSGGRTKTCWFVESVERQEVTYELSDEEAVSTKARRTLRPPSPASSMPSPNATTSSATLFFLSFLARRMSARSASGEASSSGEPTKTTTRCRRVLFCLCLSASCAIAIAVGMEAVRPRLEDVLCTAARIWPSSLVCVTSTSGLWMWFYFIRRVFFDDGDGDVGE